MMALATASTDEDRERGSVSIWLATASLVMIVLVGLAVDLGGQVHTQQHARDVAAQAARVGGEQILAGPAIRGQGLQADSGAAKSAARDYLAAAGVSGSVTIQGGDTLVVTTSDTYQTMFLGIIGLNRMTVTGRASARIVRAVGGVER
jgi:Flp pilus assembly protein TadG